MVIDVLRPLLQPGRSQLLTIAQGIVRTLLNREAAALHERSIELVAMGLTKYNIDIDTLCETMFSESGSLNDLEYVFLCSGKPKLERREFGVGIVI